MIHLYLSIKTGLDSYDIVPVDSILNGGLILEDPFDANKHWPVQSPREQKKLLRNNGY